jgi:chromate reductase
MNILTISGSNRTGSFNTMLVKALPALAPDHSFTQLNYSELPLFSQDLENPFPELATSLKESIQSADAIIVSTPEHNRSMPAALKNLLDWTGRPYGQSAWIGKTVLLMGASPAPTGTTLAQADVRKVLSYLDAHVMGQPETYISSAHEKFSADGEITDASTKEHLAKALATLAASLTP